MVTDDIGDLVKAVAQSLDPDIGAIVSAGISQGKRRRARRRAGLMVTTTASAALVVVAAMAVAGLAPSAPAANQVAHGSGQHPGRVHGSRRRPAKVQRQPAPRLEHGPGMSPKEMLAVLRGLLPAGAVLTDVWTGTGRGLLQVNYDDGRGPANIYLAVWATPRPQWTESQWGSMSAARKRQMIQQAGLACPEPPLSDEGKRPVGAPPISCATRNLPDGSLELYGVTDADAVGYYDLEVAEQRPDGVSVSIDVGNGSMTMGVEWPHVDRARPPGSLAFWESVVESPKWHL